MPSLDHPYTNLSGGQWLRGNLHAHTTRSDGRHDPQDLIDAYAERGYGFLGVSDHDMHLPTEEADALDRRGLVLLSCNEVTANGPHLLHVGAGRTVRPSWNRQRVLDDIAGDGDTFSVLNHPCWQQAFDHWPTDLMLSLHGYAGIEVFNSCMLNDIGSAYAVSKWDVLLGAGRRVWAFAHDDTHAPRDVGLGWNCVYAHDRTPAGVMDALRRGRFYASTGVTVTDIAVQRMRIRVETENAERIVAVLPHARRLAVADNRAIEVDVPAEEAFVRFECWGRGESFAWTQPFHVVD